MASSTPDTVVLITNDVRIIIVILLIFRYIHVWYNHYFCLNDYVVKIDISWASETCKRRHSIIGAHIKMILLAINIVTEVQSAICINKHETFIIACAERQCG